MRLLTNNPRKFVGLQGTACRSQETLPLEIPASATTAEMLKVKKENSDTTSSRFDQSPEVHVGWVCAAELGAHRGDLMFDALSNRLQDVFQSLKGETRPGDR